MLFMKIMMVYSNLFISTDFFGSGLLQNLLRLFLVPIIDSYLRTSPLYSKLLDHKNTAAHISRIQVSQLNPQN